MCSIALGTSKTFCRVFGFFSLLFGLIFLYYCKPLFAQSDKIENAPKWSALLPVDDNELRKGIEDNCGNTYLEKVTPRHFGTSFKNALKIFVASAFIFCAKGLFQFFMTCLNPVLARSFSITILFADILATVALIVGLFIFRSSELCLLEHTNLLYYPSQQTLVTIIFGVSMALIKAPDLASQILFIRLQIVLLKAGETRSKGVRRSEAFVTPMNSRVNSFLGVFKGRRDAVNLNMGILRRFKPTSDSGTDQALIHFQEVNSEDDLEEVDDLKKKVSFLIATENGAGGLGSEGMFEEIDLNDNRKAEEEGNLGPNANETSSVTVFHMHRPKSSESESRSNFQNTSAPDGGSDDVNPNLC